MVVEIESVSHFDFHSAKFSGAFWNQAGFEDFSYLAPDFPCISLDNVSSFNLYFSS